VDGLKGEGSPPNQLYYTPPIKSTGSVDFIEIYCENGNL